jgi:anti-anti-sigma regulatory factor
MKLTLQPLQNDAIIRVRCEGPLATDSREANGPLEQLLGPNCYSHTVLLDLTQSPSVTTSGIGWLLRSTRQFSHSGGKLVLFGVAPQVMDVLRFAMVAPHLLIASGKKAAMELAAKSAPEANGPPPRA